MRQRGFLSLTMILLIVTGIALLAATVAGKGWLNEKEAHAKTRGEYQAFVVGVEKIGKEQEERNKKELDRREKVNYAKLKSYQDRAAASNARADGLCKSAGLGPGCGDLSRVPSTARPANDAERDQRLLGVLQHAQECSDRLTALQDWVREVR